MILIFAADADGVPPDGFSSRMLPLSRSLWLNTMSPTNCAALRRAALPLERRPPSSVSPSRFLCEGSCVITQSSSLRRRGRSSARSAAALAASSANEMSAAMSYQLSRNFHSIGDFSPGTSSACMRASSGPTMLGKSMGSRCDISASSMGRLSIHCSTRPLSYTPCRTGEKPRSESAWNVALSRLRSIMISVLSPKMRTSAWRSTPAGVPAGAFQSTRYKRFVMPPWISLTAMSSSLAPDHPSTRRRATCLQPASRTAPPLL
mmetsp:Transcript_11366/g.39638  ORF Transcript_11366/g.39638 Transcript_11366/m.39638 type:complete len:262 (+) Transcript_11366:369-1154(+)